MKHIIVQNYIIILNLISLLSFIQNNETIPTNFFHLLKPKEKKKKKKRSFTSLKPNGPNLIGRKWQEQERTRVK